MRRTIVCRCPAGQSPAIVRVLVEAGFDPSTEESLAQPAASKGSIYSGATPDRVVVAISVPRDQAREAEAFLRRLHPDRSDAAEAIGRTFRMQFLVSLVVPAVAAVSVTLFWEWYSESVLIVAGLWFLGFLLITNADRLLQWLASRHDE